MLLILYSILVIVYAFYKIYNPPELVSLVFYIITMLSGGVFAVLFGLGLIRLSNNLKVNLSVLFFTVGITVYGFETYLEFFMKTEKEIIAKQMGILLDTRTKMEVLENYEIGNNNNFLYQLGSICCLRMNVYCTFF